MIPVNTERSRIFNTYNLGVLHQIQSIGGKEIAKKILNASKGIFHSLANKLKESFEIIQAIDLSPYDKDHAMVIAKYLEKN